MRPHYRKSASASALGAVRFMRLVRGGACWVLAGGAGMVISAAAAACTLSPGYTAPTNLELTTSAHLIVLAEVVGETGIDAPDTDDRSGIRLRPIRMVKGLMPQDGLAVPAMAVVPGNTMPPSDPLELAAPHDDSFSGGCIRHRFAAGQTALFFLERKDGYWRPAGGPYSRWAEDVTTPDAPWLALAGLYVHASRLSDEQQRALLEDQQEALREREDDEAAQLMADDIARQIEGLDRAVATRSVSEDERAGGESQAATGAINSGAAMQGEPARAAPTPHSSVEDALDAMRKSRPPATR